MKSFVLSFISASLLVAGQASAACYSFYQEQPTWVSALALPAAADRLCVLEVTGFGGAKSHRLTLSAGDATLLELSATRSPGKCFEKNCDLYVVYAGQVDGHIVTDIVVGSQIQFNEPFGKVNLAGQDLPIVQLK